MEQIRKMPPVEGRMETGPVQFGDDWPGVFIRGDNAAGFAFALNTLLEGQRDPFTVMAVKGLLGTLQSCIVNG